MSWAAIQGLADEPVQLKILIADEEANGILESELVEARNYVNSLGYNVEEIIRIQLSAYSLPAQVSIRKRIVDHKTSIPGAAVDIFQLDCSWGLTLQDYVLDLKPLMDKVNTKLNFSDFRSDLLHLFTTRTGKVIGVPFEMDMGVLYYNMDMLNRYKSAPRTRSLIKGPPYSSFKDMLDDAMAVKSASPNSKSFRPFIFSAAASEAYFSTLLEWINAHDGGSIIDGDGYSNVHNPEAIKAIIDMVTPNDAFSVAVFDRDSLSIVDNFDAQEALFMRNWFSRDREIMKPSALRPRENFTYGILPLPKAGVIGGWGLAIANNTPHPELAAHVVSFLTNRAAQTKRAKNQRILPAINASWTDACKDVPAWKGCSVWDFPLIERPTIAAGEYYVNISQYFVRTMRSSLESWLMIQNRSGLFEDVSTSLRMAEQVINGVLHGANENERCGSINELEIKCKPNLNLECDENICSSALDSLDDSGSRSDIVLVLATLGVAIFLIACIIVLLTLHYFGKINLFVVFFCFGKDRGKRIHHHDDFKNRNYRVDYAELESLQLIGRGSYGTVYKGIYRDTVVAVKRLNYQENRQDIMDDFQAETAVLCELRHPNVVLFMGACFDPPNLAIIIEYMPRGSLYDVIHSELQLPWALRMRMLKDICCGMAYLHSAKPPMLHRDLKSPNILVDSDFRLKVSDFGLARFKETVSKSAKNQKEEAKFVGSVYWTAPEVMRSMPFEEKSDVYSFGIIIWEVVTRAQLYPGLHPLAVGYKVIMENLRPDVPVGVPGALGDVIRNCWDPDPTVRAPFSQLLLTFESLCKACESGDLQFALEPSASGSQALARNPSHIETV